MKITKPLLVVPEGVVRLTVPAVELFGNSQRTLLAASDSLFAVGVVTSSA